MSKTDHQTGKKLKQAVSTVTVYEKKSGKSVTVYPADAREMLRQTDGFYTTIDPDTKREGDAAAVLESQEQPPEPAPVIDSPAPSEVPSKSKSKKG